ncbi:MAG: carbohydrate kinase family protein [Candidatus Gottesmanbacteria bacterium]
MNNKSILVIGDVAIDVFLTPEAGETLCQMKAQEKYICFSYGDKIPVDHLEFFTGGNAANVSVGLRRLDIPASIFTTIGSDSVSTLIYEHLQHAQVDTKYVTMQPGAASNYSTIISYQGERTIFTYHAPKVYVYQKQAALYSYVYLTSMGERFLPFYKDLMFHLTENPGITLMFNPGSLQTRANPDDIRLVIARTNVLFVNRKEAEIFSNIQESQGKEKEVLQTLHAIGPHTVIITDGENGVYAVNGSSFVKSSVLPVTVIEKTGAGDAFNSGFIAAILNGLQFEQALQWGTINAASVIGYVGAQKGLLYRKDIDSWSRIFENAKVTIEAL